MPKKKHVQEASHEGFSSVKITVTLTGRSNQKIQELRLDGGGIETKAQIVERIVNSHLNKLPLKS